MIKVLSYQVYDNCVGDCVIAAAKVNIDLDSMAQVEGLRKQIMASHKDIVDQHRATHAQHGKLTAKESRNAITVYFQFKEVPVEKKLT